MRDTALRAFVGVVLGTGLLTLAACGGGGGGGDGGGGETPPSPALFSGAYGLTTFSGLTDPAVIHETTWGRLVSDGANSFSTNFSYNDGTTVNSDMQDHAYALGVGRTLTFASGAAQYATGRLAASGDLSALSFLFTGRNPGIHLDLRRGESQTNANLTGTFKGCMIGYLPGISKPEAHMGTYTFSGLGGWNATYHVNLEGTVVGPQTSDPGTYFVGATGNTTFTFGSGFTEQGQLLAGGDVLSVGGGTSDGNALYYYCLVKEGSGMSTASLSGTYGLVGIYYDFTLGVLDWVGVGGTLTANGTGGYSATFRMNEAGVISGPTTQTGTYALAADGHLVVTQSDGQVFEGGLSPDRTFAVYGGGTSQLSRPGIFMLVK